MTADRPCQQKNLPILATRNRSARSPIQAAPHWALTSLCTGIACLTLSSPGQAQQAADMLPPPPSIPASSGESPIIQTVPIQSGSPANQPTAPLQETVFQAPIASPPKNPGRYVVYVNGDSPYLLQQVRAVEAKAFVQTYQGRRVIQVGSFNDEANAQRQTAALAMQGIRAEIAGTRSGGTQSGQQRYLVVIPGRQEELSSLNQQAIRLGIRPDTVQAKATPLGPHLEIGPFLHWGDAEDVSRNLRRSGLDARVYYSR